MTISDGPWSLVLTVYAVVLVAMVAGFVWRTVQNRQAQR